MPDQQAGEVWILGATGRVGGAVAQRLAAHSELALVLVGRDAARLQRAAEQLGRPARIVVAESAAAMADHLRRRSITSTSNTSASNASASNTVVVNTVGPYTETAVTIARACMPEGHYLDLANDLVSMPALLGLHDEAVTAGSTLVTGAGFGVLATEAIVARLCENRPTPAHVQVDALSSSSSPGGTMGAAFAGTILDVMAFGGRRFRDGRLVRSRLGSGLERFALPDGTSAAAAAVPSGELIAAQRASGAPSVVATSALAPTSPIVRAILPTAGALLGIGAVRRFATRRLAAIRLDPAPRPRPHSWGHAQVEWADGTSRSEWLRADDAMDYTAAVACEVAIRLAAGQAPAGAYTPAAAFGADLAVNAGGRFIAG